MTNTDVYCSAMDRQIITNSEWGNPNYRYIKIGSKVFVDNVDLISEIRMLEEKDTDTWRFNGQISRFEKLKLRIRLILQIWRQTK